jgi:hypothetical protein
MPDILHRISIDASPQRVHDLIASTDGIARWWSGRPLTGEHSVEASFSVHFGDTERPAAVMRVLTDTADEVVWLVTDGPAYLTSLKTGAETGAFAAYPAGEVSRWG